MRCREFGEMLVDKAGVHSSGDHVGMLQQILQKRNGGGNALNTELTEYVGRSRHRAGKISRRRVDNHFGFNNWS